MEFNTEMKVRKDTRGGVWWSVLAIAGVLVIWEIASRSGTVNALLLPAPSQVARAFIDLVQSGALLRDVAISVRRAFLGFVAGSVVGTALGLLTARVSLIRSLLNPLLQMARALPPVAIIPLVILWFGIGDVAKIWSISFAVLFPVWISTHTGAGRVPAVYLWAARSFGFTRGKELLRIVLPSSLPFIEAGLRTGVAVAFVMVFVSELAGADSGLGYEIAVAQLAYRVDQMLAALIVLALLAALSDYILLRTTRRLFPWLRETPQP